MKFARDLFSNLFTLLLSLLLAILIWLNASLENNPIRLQSFQIPLEYIGQPENAVLVAEIESVVIIVEGRSSIINQLTSEDFPAYIDLSRVPLGEDTMVNVVVQPRRTGIDVNSISPAQVKVRLDQLVSREVPVVLDIRGSVARGHTQGTPLADPEAITVVGTPAQVDRLDSARVTVFLNNVSDTVVASQLPIFYDRQGRVASTSGLRSVSHEEVRVTIPVEESADYAEKFIEVDWRGTPADGYRLLSIQVDPPSLLVRGLPTRLTEITQIRTEPIDITGLTETFTQQVALNFPIGITPDEVQVIKVTVEIEPILTTGVYNRPVEVLGVEPGLTAVVQPEEVRVVLFGPLPVLDTLPEGEVRVTVDAIGLLTGTYSLEPTVTLPDRGVELRSVQPAVVNITIGQTISDTLDSSAPSRFWQVAEGSGSAAPSLAKSAAAQKTIEGSVKTAVHHHLKQSACICANPHPFYTRLTHHLLKTR
jgi:YbbR domain-containing protein